MHERQPGRRDGKSDRHLVKLSSLIVENGGFSITFIADGMLGTTARKLRILGFDTTYEASLPDQDLMKLALESGRTLLTGDHQLFVTAKSSGAKAVLVHGQSEEARLYEILQKCGLGKIRMDSLVSRCSICNGTLVGNGVSMNNYGEVFSCTSCGKKYWKGSHWNKINSLFESVNALLVVSAAKR